MSTQKIYRRTHLLRPLISRDQSCSPMMYRTLAIVALALVFSAHLAHAQHDDHEAVGEVQFEITCSDEAQERFNEALSHLHHMMYSRAQSVFNEVIALDPECAMGHWGVAMTSFQPLWAPTSDGDLQRGKASVDAALRLGADTEREAMHIAAVEAFFTDPDPPAADRPTDHRERIDAWKKAQRELHEAHPEDVDAAAFYALADISYAMTLFSPDEERDFSRERRAGAMLEAYYEQHPAHPGIFHYLIHAYDSAELAHKAEEYARGYDQLAPDTPHALHMPSHIFVRMGMWEETADWNKRSAEAALNHPYNGRVSLHYPHALDYMMYAYLQMGAYEKAKETLDRLRTIDETQPHFASAYAVAAGQARYFLEQGLWGEAAELRTEYPATIDWDGYEGATALVHYARGLGAARTGDLEQAAAERDAIEDLVASMRDAGNTYWAYMTEALQKAVGAWIRYEEGATEDALTLMREAADLEDSMDKHPITPGEVLPVRELYGEMLLKEDRQADAQRAFEASLERTPNRKHARRHIEQIDDAQP